MAKTRSPEDIVAAFVKNHALVDKHLAAAYQAALAMAKDTEEGISTGMMSDALDAKDFLATHRELPGLIARSASFAADLHKRGTAIAKANGVDLGSVTTVGGVLFGGIVIMGGGR